MSLRRILLFASLVAISILLIANFGNFKQFLTLIQHANWYILSLVLLAQGWSYYNNAKYYQSFLRLFGYRIKTKLLFGASLGLNFVNQAFPSGGVSGTSYLTTVLADVPTGKVTLAQLMRYAFTFASFVVVLVLGFSMLFIGKSSLNPATIWLTLVVMLAVIAVGVVAAVVIADRTRLEQVAGVLQRWLNTIGTKWLRRKRKLITDQQLDHFFVEFYEGYKLLLAEKGKWRWPLFYALLGNLAEVLTVYIVFLAFGQPVNPGIVITGYTLANIFSIAAVFTGGVGLYEATMIGAFAALGVPFTVAFSVVVVYRVLNFGLGLPIGFYYYRKQVMK